jgi:hypothetical protein
MMYWKSIRMPTNRGMLRRMMGSYAMSFVAWRKNTPLAFTAVLYNQTVNPKITNTPINTNPTTTFDLI